MRKASIKISSRKISDIPTVEKIIEFVTAEEFMEKADKAIEKACLSSGFVGVKCCVDNSEGVFNDDEVKMLEDDFFIVE
jgi:hypothetical protein